MGIEHGWWCSRTQAETIWNKGNVEEGRAVRGLRF